MVATSAAMSLSTVVSSNKAKLMSVYVTTNTTCVTTNFVVKVWDSSDTDTTNANEMFRFTANENHSLAALNFESDLHGAIAGEGLFVEISGTGTVFLTYE